MAIISPKAIVENPANLADDVVVGAFTYIGGDVKIASGCQIDNNVSIDGTVTIDENVHVSPYAVIGQNRLGHSGSGEVKIGTGSKIREHAVISSGSEADKSTVIGKKNLVMTGCFIGSDVQVGTGVVLGNYSSYDDGAIIEDFVWSAAFTGVDKNVRIGKYSFTSGYAGINTDAPPFAMLQGFPFKIRGVNTLNLKRRGIDEKDIEQLKDAFKLLFSKKANIDEAIGTLSQWAASEHLDYLVNYVKQYLCSSSDGGE